MKKDHEKEIFALWRDFLKQSSEYKEFCDALHEKKKPDIQLFEKYRHVFAIWGDIYRTDFESWWSENEKKHKKCVTELSESIERDIDSTIDSIRWTKFLEKKKSVEPTLQEFKEHFLNSIASRAGCIYLKINIDPGQTRTALKKRISAEMSDILGKYCDNNSRVNWWLFRYQPLRHCYPTEFQCQQLRINLNKYLKAKDRGYIDSSGRFRHGKRRAILEDDKCKEPDAGGLAYTRAIKEVREVIRNAEMGFFPWIERKGENKGPRSI